MAAVKLEFEPIFHEYRIDGRIAPSVSQVLAPLEDFESVPRETLESARIFGQHVHEACALLVRDELDWASLDPALVPYLMGARRFLEESGITIIASETRVVCPKLRVAGTLDILGHWRNTECVIDWKATAAIPRSVGPQTSAYEQLYRSMRGGAKRRRYCVQLRDNDYRVVPLTDPADWNIFLSCLNLWRYKNASAA